MTFSIDLSRAIAKAKKKQELVVKKVMLEAFTKVVMRSPVDSGRFRANWTVGVGGFSRNSLQAVDPSGSATVGKIAQDVTGLSFGGQTVYLTNALAYATRLERGWSKQAPQGMVALTLTELTAKYGT